MTDVLGGVVVLAVVALVVILNVRRRARMSPEQREIQNLKREARELKREQRRQRWN